MLVLQFRRTVKSLCCIGKGTPIVDVSWIKKCRELKSFVECCKDGKGWSGGRLCQLS
ncbi:hypothetical protein V5799_015980, partial [Amblyomma americanum]